MKIFERFVKHLNLKTFHCKEQRNISFVSQRASALFKVIRLDECKDVFNAELHNLLRFVHNQNSVSLSTVIEFQRQCFGHFYSS